MALCDRTIFLWIFTKTQITVILNEYSTRVSQSNARFSASRRMANPSWSVAVSYLRHTMNVSSTSSAIPVQIEIPIAQKRGGVCMRR